jgi:hypothetical protein
MVDEAQNTVIELTYNWETHVMTLVTLRAPGAGEWKTFIKPAKSYAAKAQKSFVNLVP